MVAERDSEDLITRSGSNTSLPSDWQELPLQTVARVRFSGVDKHEDSGERAVRLCNYIDVYNNEYITADKDYMAASASDAEIASFGIRRGDVIITKDSETPDDIGISAVVDCNEPDLVCGYHLALLRPKDGMVDPTFLAKQLRHHRLAKYFGHLANGLTRYGLPTSVVENAPLWLPSIGEQRAVAALLRLVDEAITNEEAVIAKLRQLRTGLLRDLLTFGLDEHANLRDPVAHNDEFRDSRLGSVPRNWDIRMLGQACDWSSGGTPDRSCREWWQGALPFLTPKDMKTFHLKDTIEHITEEAGHVGSKVMPEETAYIVVRGMILAHTFPVVFSSRRFAFNQDIKAARGCAGLSTRYFAYWLRGNENLFLRKTTEATHGTKKIDLSEIYRIEIAVPPEPEQREIVRRIEQTDDALKAEERKAVKLALLKSGLMTDLLTGRVRVPESTASKAA
jgi:type I restriction enzyme, S subunit